MSASTSDRTSVSRLQGIEQADIARLSAALIDCVESGASVSPMHGARMRIGRKLC